MRFILRRIAFYLITAWAAVTLNFVIPRLMPGNPAEILLTRFQGRLSPKGLASLTTLFDLNTLASVLEQYFQYWGQLFSANLGISFSFFPEPVSSVLINTLPWTVILTAGPCQHPAPGTDPCAHRRGRGPRHPVLAHGP